MNLESVMLGLVLITCNLTELASASIVPQNDDAISYRKVPGFLGWSPSEASVDILFAYRDVPVETLGYSPIDLLFGRPVAGPLSLLKSSWLQETNLGSTKQNVVEFILKTREQFRHALQAAHEYTVDSRSISKQWYDRRTVLSTFETRDKVLVLLPIPGKPLHENMWDNMSFNKNQDQWTMLCPQRRDEKINVCVIVIALPVRQ